MSYLYIEKQTDCECLKKPIEQHAAMTHFDGLETQISAVRQKLIPVESSVVNYI